MIAFILSHFRADSCPTLDMLKRFGYTGDYRIVVDDEDDQLPLYKSKYDDKLVVFHKRDYIYRVDTGYRTDDIRLSSPVYPKVFLENFVNESDIDEWILLDDDIKNLVIRCPNEIDKTLPIHKITDINLLFEHIFNYMHSTNITCLSTSHQGLFIGGYKSYDEYRIMNRRMYSNIAFRIKGRRMDWKTVFYDDSNTCLNSGKTGEIMFQLPFICSEVELQNGQLQVLDKELKLNGFSNEYKKTTQYERAFFSVIIQPSGVYVKEVKREGNFWMAIKNDNCFPRIISSRFKLR